MDCAHNIPDLSYGEFSKQLHDSVIEQRTPVSGSIDITSGCNLRCVHCYMKDSPNRRLSYRDLKLIVDQLADAGCLWLLLTGGEPLLHPDFKKFYSYARRRGMLLTLFTNGTLLTRETADMLDWWGAFSVEVTLYGASDDTYRQITGSADAFEKCLRGISLLCETDLNVSVKSVILAQNQHELGDMKRIAESHGLPFRYDFNINPRLDGSAEPCDHRLSCDDAIIIDALDEQRVLALKEFYQHVSGREYNHEYIFHCGAGMESFHIDSEGKLNLCVLMREPAYDILNGSFAEGWKTAVFNFRMQKGDLDTRCDRCEYFGFCDQCPAWAKLEEGDYKSATGFACRIAHMRVEKYCLKP